jgi:hypothetical protein
VHAFQIHAREIGIFLVQIVPLADSARLAREVVTHEVLADISHLPSGFARDVKRFILGMFGDSFDSFSVCGHDYNVPMQGAKPGASAFISSIFLKMDKTKKFMLKILTRMLTRMHAFTFVCCERELVLLLALLLGTVGCC